MDNNKYGQQQSGNYQGGAGNGQPNGQYQGTPMNGQQYGQYQEFWI